MREGACDTVRLSAATAPWDVLGGCTDLIEATAGPRGAWLPGLTATHWPTCLWGCGMMCAVPASPGLPVAFTPSCARGGGQPPCPSQ